MNQFTNYHNDDDDFEPWPWWVSLLTWLAFFAVCVVFWVLVFVVLVSLSYALDWIYRSVA
jgi:hypothetical protein